MQKSFICFLNDTVLVYTIANEVHRPKILNVAPPILGRIFFTKLLKSDPYTYTPKAF